MYNVYNYIQYRVLCLFFLEKRVLCLLWGLIVCFAQGPRKHRTSPSVTSPLGRAEHRHDSVLQQPAAGPSCLLAYACVWSAWQLLAWSLGFACRCCCIAASRILLFFLEECSEYSQYIYLRLFCNIQYLNIFSGPISTKLYIHYISSFDAYFYHILQNNSKAPKIVELIK